MIGKGFSDVAREIREAWRCNVITDLEYREGLRQAGLTALLPDGEAFPPPPPLPPRDQDLPGETTFDTEVPGGDETTMEATDE